MSSSIYKKVIFQKKKKKILVFVFQIEINIVLKSLPDLKGRRIKSRFLVFEKKSCFYCFEDILKEIGEKKNKYF